MPTVSDLLEKLEKQKNMILNSDSDLAKSLMEYIDNISIRKLEYEIIGEKIKFTCNLKHTYRRKCK